MAGVIKTPTNQKLLTNVAVVRMKRAGKRFEIACYKNKVVNWRNKTEKNIDEVLQTENVFVNVSKGQLAKREDLMAAFSTENKLEICKIILEKGDLQVSEKERHAHSETSFKDIANIIAAMCVNPETKRPYSSAVIEKALKDSHFSLNANRSSKQQALDAIPKLRESIQIERAKMRLRIEIPSKEARSLHNRIKALFETVEVENWDEGVLDIVGLIAPGSYRQAEEFVRKETKNHGVIELLSLKVIQEGDVEIS